jgi:hypothetical protein
VIINNRKEKMTNTAKYLKGLKAGIGMG